MRGDGPLSCLSDFFDSFILEHLDEVLLNSTFDDSRVLLWWTVDNWDLEGDLWSVRIVELLPCLGIG